MKISIGMSAVLNLGYNTFNKTERYIARSTPSDKANVSAAKLLRTTRLIRFDCQEIKLNLEFSFTKNINCPPWLPPCS